MTVGTNKLRKTKSQKWLAAAIQNNFKWDLHVTEIVTKASNRLHVLLVLKRGGTLSPDLLREHLTLIRSVLESCCPILHSSLTVHLSDKIERIQRRALSIFHPKKRLWRSLAPRQLRVFARRRDALCVKTFQKNTGVWFTPESPRPTDLGEHARP